MKDRLKMMADIMDQKDKDLLKKQLQPLDPEGKAMAEHKRFTFDIVTVPTDPLR